MSDTGTEKFTHSINSDYRKAISTKNRHEEIDAAPFQGKIAPDGAPSKARRLRLGDRLYHLGDAQ